MLSQQSKQELLDAIRPRYRKAKKVEKRHLLDEFVAATARVFLHDPVGQTNSVGTGIDGAAIDGAAIDGAAIDRISTLRCRPVTVPISSSSCPRSFRLAA